MKGDILVSIDGVRALQLRCAELEADNAKLRAAAVDRNLECADVILKLRARLASAEAVCEEAARLDAGSCLSAWVALARKLDAWREGR